MKKIDDVVPLPSKAQLKYHRDELAAFIHFGINTFYEQEWGNGQEDPRLFNPSKLDTDQWIRVLKETGFKRVIVVVKHHDGFVLYPSRYTDYTVAASPWRDGKGDLLAEISCSATKYDMDLGIYLSPWDAHSPLYHIDTQETYNDYYQKQLEEILSNPLYGNKGKFVEVWMDGARGEGAQKVTYNFEKWFEIIRHYQKEALIFSTQATELRWIGNESGRASDPLWQKIRPEKLSEQTPLDYLLHGDPKGTYYSLGEADVSLRSGWFYHENQTPKSLADLLDIYLHSVGRGTPLLLNVPPTKEGLLSEMDCQRLREFYQVLSELYKRDLALGAKVTSSSEQSGHLSGNLTDGRNETFWAPDSEEDTYVFEIDLGRSCSFDLVEIREPIAKGQRIAGFVLEVEEDTGWTVFARGQTIGYKRLLLGEVVEARHLRLILTDFQASPLLSKFAVYRTPAIMERKSVDSGLEFSQKNIAIAGQTSLISLSRMDGLEKAERIRITTEPGTGVHGVAYQDQIWDVVFAPGEATKSVNLATIEFSGQKEVYFYLCAIREDGRQSRTKVRVQGHLD